MLNITVVALILLILIYQNILLLNEETLVLICFVTFVWLFYKNIGQSVKDNLNNQSKTIKNSMEDSFESLIISLEKQLEAKKEFENLAFNFLQLKRHFLNLNSVVSLKLPHFSFNYYQNVYKKKLIFAHKLENQTAKLLALLIAKKLTKIVHLKKFYIQVFKVPNLYCSQKISLREYFNFVSLPN